MNERITENHVRQLLKDKFPDSIIEEQKSSNSRINNALSKASKQGGGGVGKPEFIVTHPDYNHMIMVIECKADTNKHSTIDLDNPKTYALDGAVHYAKALAQLNLDVVAVGVSGENPFKITSCIVTKDKVIKLGEDTICSFDYYLQVINADPQATQQRLIDSSVYLHNYLRDYAKLTETEKPLLVGACMLALKSNSFRRSYKFERGQSLANLICHTISGLIEKDLPLVKVANITQIIDFIKTHSELTKETEVLLNIVEKIDNEIRPFMFSSTDILGQFYGEFLKYTGGDKKGLGIVLTPKHVCELMVELAGVTKDSVVLDNCMGTGGFLIAAMHKMIELAGNDEQKIKDIKANQLVGIEQQNHMFFLAAANMIFRGDGKANLHLGSCFEDYNISKVKDHKPTVALLNPPFAQKGKNLAELDFVCSALDDLEPNGICVAIVPMSCALQDNNLREQLLSKHTLLAVMSMPIELFYPTGATTCIMVFKAHVPHDPNIKSWFGYWREDGFVKTKTKGRVDLNNKWESIKTEWLNSYRNHEELPGKSVMASITAKDEWCAEAYMETDYSQLTQKDFEAVVKEYILHCIRQDIPHESI